jgi:hypothetical protein
VNIHQGFGDVSNRTRQGMVGLWAMLSGLNRSFCGINASPQKVKIQTITVADPGDSQNITLTVNGTTVTYSTGVGKDLATIGAELAAAIEAEPLARGVLRASFAGTTLTLTGLWPGQDYTVTLGGVALSALTTTQAATAASPVIFGRAVVQYDWNSNLAGQESERLVAQVDSSLFVAQVVTLTPAAYEAGAKVRVRVYEVWGAERQLLADKTETMATNLATTLAALAASLNGAGGLAADTVNVTVNGGNTALIFTAERLGMEILVEAGIGDEGATMPALPVTETTGPSPATSLHRAWCGIAMYSPAEEQPVGGAEEGQYGPNVGVVYGQQGPIWVRSDEAISWNQPTVYVELAPGANAGRFYNTPSATRVRLGKERARWDRDGINASESLAVVRLLSY